MSEIGPVEYLIVAFPGNKFRGEIAPALADLVEAGTIRIMDIAFVGKDEDGTVVAFELADIDPDVREGLENLGIEPSGLFSRRGSGGRRRGAGAEHVGCALGLGGRVGPRGRGGDASRGGRPLRLRPPSARGRAGRTRLRTGKQVSEGDSRCHSCAEDRDLSGRPPGPASPWASREGSGTAKSRNGPRRSRPSTRSRRRRPPPPAAPAAPDYTAELAAAREAPRPGRDQPRGFRGQEEADPGHLGPGLSDSAQWAPTPVRDLSHLFGVCPGFRYHETSRINERSTK